MQRHVRILLAALTAGTIVGCASTPNVNEGLRPCTTEVSGSDLTTWNEVRAEGFTFCVPPDWRGNRNEWKRADSYVRWGLGVVPARPMLTRVEVTRVPAGGIPAGGTPIMGNSVRMTETIGGRPAELFRSPVLTHYATGATWASPEIYLEGATKELDIAALQFTIYRSVRFIP
jgi:hypothetical protein